MNGYISNANYSKKRMTFLLFINRKLRTLLYVNDDTKIFFIIDRSVDSTNIKRAIETVYSALLPKGGYPFVYLSLEIDPKNVDVNIHPTKKEVHFLNEDKIIDSLIDTFQETLENANHSRTFLVQTLLPGAPAPKEEDEGKPESSMYVTDKHVLI
jgi:DNA mismatch repair protein MLH1